jgi:hypothetical protein
LPSPKRPISKRKSTPVKPIGEALFQGKN